MTNLLHNQFLSGGLLLGALAGAATLVKRYGSALLRHLVSRFVVEVEIRDGAMVEWFGLWLTHIRYGQSCRRMKVDVRHDRKLDKPKLSFEPGPGSHFVRHDGRWFIAERHRNDEDKEMAANGEWYRIRFFGSRERAMATMEAAKTFASELLAQRDTAHISDGAGWWGTVNVGVPRSLSTVVLPAGMVDGIVSRIRTFLGQQDWYAERGIPWRVGFLLEGPPRTGKTSLVRAVAHDLGLPLYVLDLTSKDFSDRALAMTLSRVPTRALVLIEDIDQQLGADTSLITLSGLLNALDGPLASEGRVLFVTTNAQELLDAALVGEGRLDVHVHFEYATREQAHEIFLRFFPGHTEEARAFAEIVPERTLPLAAIQEHLVARSDDAARAVAEAHLLARKEVRVVRREVAA